MHNLGMFMNYSETKLDKNKLDMTFVIKHSLTQTRTQISNINNK